MSKKVTFTLSFEGETFYKEVEGKLIKQTREHTAYMMSPEGPSVWVASRGADGIQYTTNLAKENIYDSEENFFEGNALNTERARGFWASSFFEDFFFDFEDNKIVVFTDEGDKYIDTFAIHFNKDKSLSIFFDGMEDLAAVHTYLSASDRDKYREMDVVDENGTHTHVSPLSKLKLNYEQREAWDALRKAMEKINNSNMYVFFDTDKGGLIAATRDGVDYDYGSNEGASSEYASAINGRIPVKYFTYLCEDSDFHFII